MGHREASSTSSARGRPSRSGRSGSGVHFFYVLDRALEVGQVGRYMKNLEQILCEQGIKTCVPGLDERFDIQFVPISAKGTSLGGDDGIAVAYCLAILDDDMIK